MRVSASEKLELIRLVEGSSLSVRRTLAEIGLSRSTFYAWYQRYLEGGPEALEDRKPRPRAVWNRISDRIRTKVIETALVHTQLSPRELACRMTDREGEFLSESSVYRILKAADLIESPAYILLQAADRFQHPTRRRNELWQTDFTYLPVVGWGGYYLSTVLDDYSRKTQGKIERWHRSMKNVVRLENYYSPWELERALARFVEYYNHERVHEAIGDVTPDDMYHGRQRAILSRREKIKRLTLERRKKENLRNAA